MTMMNLTGPSAWTAGATVQAQPIPCPRARSRCEHTVFRFSHTLTRKVPLAGGGRTVAIMLNPSCPDEGNVMFGKVRNLCDEPSRPVNEIVFLNVFAYRERHLQHATEVDVRNAASRNREVADATLASADEIIAAWGAPTPYKHLRKIWHEEVEHVLTLLSQHNLVTLGMGGRPTHPRAWRRTATGEYRPNLQPLRT